MKKIALAFMVVLLLITLMSILTSDFVSSSTPGWHTVILSPYTIFFGYPSILVVAAFYFYTVYNKKEIKKQVYIIYVLLILPLLSLCILRYCNLSDTVILNIIAIVLLSKILYFAAQVYFMVVIIKFLKDKKKFTN
jgi:hypothetical protein